MSKLLTDLMEAERKRRQIAVGPGAEDVQEGPPAVSARPWSEDPGVMRLRLDDRLMNRPLEKPNIVPSGRAP